MENHYIFKFVSFKLVSALKKKLASLLASQNVHKPVFRLGIHLSLHASLQRRQF